MKNATKIIYERLTDDEIDRLSQNRIIITDKDFNLKRNSKYEKNRLYPEVGGVYDSDYFGSIYTDTCNCGRTNSVGTLCQRCNSRVLTEEEKYKRYARIDLDWYYVTSTKIVGLIGLLAELPLDLTLAQEFFGFRSLSKSSTPKICELCQFDWDEDLQEILVKPIVNNESHSSYEGLELIIKEHFPSLLSKFRSLVNKKVLVVPAVYRMASFNPYDPVTKLSIPFLSSLYQAIVHAKLYINALLTDDYSEPSERVLLKAMLRRFCAKIPEQVSEVLLPSKQNILRNVMSSRIDDSGRAPIVGDPSLAIDEVKIPIHLAYEILRVDFIAYLAKTLNISLVKAEVKYRQASKDTLDLFRKYTPTRRVIMNRPPSLHRYNNMSFIFYTTDDQAIHFPITSVEPFAADFDGDAMSFFLVPEEMNELFDQNASPGTQLRYESSNDFIWRPNQDMLFGLTLSTRVIPSDTDDKCNKYISLEDAIKDYDSQVIMYPTDHIIMNNKVTSLSREVVGSIIRRDVSDLYGEDYINSTNIHILLTYLYTLPDFTQVYQKLVEYALEVLTLEGATVPSLAEMISVDTSKFTEEMRELVEKSMKDPRYFYELEKMYEEFVAEQVRKLSPDLSRRIKDSGRMKMQQVIDMMLPQMTVDADGNYYIATNSLSCGLSHEDYVHHAVNNRAILQMKQEITPNAGYCNRQLIFAGQGVKFKDVEETSPNEGVWIPRNRAEGRTTVDGEVLGKSDSEELVLVRSFATSDSPYVSADMISQVYNKFLDQSNIGLKFTSAVAGVVTQGGLSLKHTGILRKLDKNVQLHAKEDCSVRRLTTDTIEIRETSGVKYTHFIPSDFILTNPTGQYKKGEVIGFRPVFSDPGYRGKVIIDLLGALSTKDIEVKHEKDFALCVSPVSGTVHYDMEYVHIGSVSIPRNPERVYYFFEGQTIEKYSIICDGVLDCTNIPNYCPTNRDYYGCFRTYFLSVLPNTNEQTIEYIFRTINTRDMNGNLTYVGVKEKVRGEKSVLTNAGYEGAKVIIPSLLANESVEETTEDYDDLFLEYYLNMLRNYV